MSKLASARAADAPFAPNATSTKAPQARPASLLGNPSTLVED